MVFNSLEFVVFFIGVYGVYLCLRHRVQNFFLLTASYFFYGCWDWRFLFLLFLTTILDFVCAQKIAAAVNPKLKKNWLWISLCGNLSVLGFFKYFNFFTENFVGLFNALGIHLNPFILKIILPVGVSFYTFQSISYIVDVYKGRIQAEENVWIYALYVAFFPQLVAGPIERAQHMLAQYRNPRRITAEKIRDGVWFVIWGFFLKVFLADNMAKLADIVFNQKGIIPGVEVLLGSYAFAFQILGDFAGYSFIAMGIARLMGIELMTNFLFPYFVTNPRDFWRHWHISLSQWLRDYLYIPLGGSRWGAFQTYRNLMLTMFLGGLWHGAAWTFVLWGIYQGTLLCIHRWITTQKYRGDELKPVSKPRQIIKIWGMFQLTCLGWLIFRAESLAHLKDLLWSLFGNFRDDSLKVSYLAGQIVFFVWIVLVIQYIQQKKGSLVLFAEKNKFLRWVVYGILFYLFVFFGEFGGQEFIYFQF